MELKQAIKNRRSFYSISSKSPIADEEIKSLIDTAVLSVPSAFNSQSTRLVLLLNEHHVRFWDIVKDTLKGIPDSKAFEGTKAKIENCFQAGYGTVLFFEDQSIVKKLQEAFSLYKDNFPVWSNQTSAMHQYAVWLMLEEAGFGASLQHYNPLIDNAVLNEWNLSPDWKLIAQMPFGAPTEQPGNKEVKPLDGRRFFFE